MISRNSSIYIIYKLLINCRSRFFYFLDYFGYIKQTYILKTKFGRIYCRPNTVDRWIATENLILDQFDLRNFSNAKIETIIDIGANIGTFTILAKKIFPKANIICIEPIHENIIQLRKNLDLNKINDSSVKIIEAAITEKKSKKVKIYLNKNHASHSTEKDFIGSTGKSVLVKNINFSNLDQYIKGNTLVKIDIEGQEKYIIKSEYKKLLSLATVILLEFHDLPLQEKQLHEKFFRFIGYKNIKWNTDILIAKKF